MLGLPVPPAVNRELSMADLAASAAQIDEGEPGEKQKKSGPDHESHTRLGGVGEFAIARQSSATVSIVSDFAFGWSAAGATYSW